MVVFILGMVAAYVLTGLCSTWFPTPAARRAYTPGTLFVAWPGVLFPDSPFGKALSWSLRPRKT